MAENNFLVSASWLEQHLSDPDLRIVDVRGQVLGRELSQAELRSHYHDYTYNHIPGAVFLDWIEDICADPLTLGIAAADQFAAAMSRIGVGPDTFVVVYDDAESVLAARLWWTLHYYGHTNVAVMDGGWINWLADKRPTAAEIPAIAPAEFVPRPDPTLRQTTEEVFMRLKGTTRLLDLRSATEFGGSSRLPHQRGHIPGAVNLPLLQLIASDNKLRKPETLRRMFADLGIDGSEPEVIVCSRFGIASCLGLLAMRIAGLENGTVYDASWHEWADAANYPVEQ